MIFSILGCMKSLLWVLLVLLGLFYLFGITFTSASNSFLKTTESRQHPDNKPLEDYFGTVGRSILTLFMSMSGGNDWSVYYEALAVLAIQYRMAYLLFIIFSTMAVANIVTGIFVDSALQSNQSDRDIIVHEELEARKEYLKSMQDLFMEMDEDEKGTICFEEFE